MQGSIGLVSSDPLGGTGRRQRPAGVLAGAALTKVHGPSDALAWVADDLAAAEGHLRGLIHSDVAAVPQVAGWLADAGGKRLRPALAALGARTVGLTRPYQRLLCAGELIHLGSLLHDDVVDEGPERRGRPAAHVVHGNAVTVLTGDFCLARAVLLAAEEGGHLCVTALARAVTEMAEGEVLQLRHQGDLDTDADAYFDVIDRKSAALIAWCAASGAWAADRPEQAAALERFGRGVGVAFQITDDVLDYATGTGKAAGADLRQRKVTLPLLFAMQADPGLKDALRAGDPTPTALPGLLDRVRATGAIERSYAEAAQRVHDAVAALNTLPAGPGRDKLASLGRYLVERSL